MANVLAIKKKTPYGANFIMMFTSSMTTLLASSNQLPMRFPCSPDSVMAKPTKIANTIICSILALTIASNGLVGIILIITSESGGFSLASKVASPTGIPTPGWKIEANVNAKVSAIAVVNRYKPIDFKLKRPSFEGSANEQTPQTKETKTRGTISIFKALMKRLPPILNRPSTK